MIRRTYRYLLAQYARVAYRGRHRRLVMEQVGDKAFVVLPDVFNPVLFRSSVFLVEQLVGRVQPHHSVLDMGTGSGVGAVFAADISQRVVAVDINPEAVRCATINALLNRVDDRVCVQQSDLFGTLGGQRFDVVLFNPPYYAQAPADDYDHAWRGENLFQRFAAGLPAYLTPNGFALVVFSSDGDEGALLAALHEAGLCVEAVAVRDLINEILTVYRIETDTPT